MFKNNLLSSKECKQLHLLKLETRKTIPIHVLQNIVQDFVSRNSVSTPNHIEKYLRQDENLTKEMCHVTDKIVFQNKDAKKGMEEGGHTSSITHSLKF